MYAQEFVGIQDALKINIRLRSHFSQLVASDVILGRVLEGTGRVESFRPILSDLGEGSLSLDQAYRRTEMEIPQHSSPLAGDGRVFATGWAERLVRTQLSRFYNQAVLALVLADGQTHVHVPHSPHEAPSSQCSQLLAGRSYPAQVLHDNLVAAYRDGDYGKNPKIPHHPHCTHVVVPQLET
jgi:hypothetical protein